MSEHWRLESEAYSKIKSFERALKILSWTLASIGTLFSVSFFIGFVIIIIIFSSEVCLYHRFYNYLHGTLSIELHRRIDVVASHISQ